MVTAYNLFLKFFIFKISFLVWFFFDNGSIIIFEEFFFSSSITYHLSYLFNSYFFCIFLSSTTVVLLMLSFLSFFCSVTFFENTVSPHLKAYECGFDPSTSMFKSIFTFQYYSLALVFLIFDIEVLFLFPWAAMSKFFVLNNFFLPFFCMWPFMFFLLISMFYECILSMFKF